MLQEEAIFGTFDDGYTEGLAKGYTDGYEVGEVGFASPEEEEPSSEYSY